MAVSNYVRQAIAARDAFLRWDQEAMIRRYGLDADRDFLYIAFCGGSYRVSRKSGQIDLLSGEFWEECLDFDAVMSIYDVLCRDKTPTLSGEVCSIFALPNVVLSSGLGSSTFTDAARWFSGKTEALCRACRALGGTALEGGDAAFRLPVFPFFPVILRFWDADEEFPAQLNLLWDKNSQQFVRYETLYYIAGSLA